LKSLINTAQAQEITTDEKYILDDTKYPVEFAYSGEDTAVQEIEVNNGSAIENALKKGEIQGIKTDADSGSGLGGALIGIFFNDETDFAEDNAIETVTIVAPERSPPLTSIESLS
jgi:uncharacterized surface anchored protein